MVYLITIEYLFLGASTIYFSTIYLDNLKYLFHIEECFDFMYVCALNLFMLPTEFRRGCWIALNCSYMWLSSNKWVLGVKPRSSEGRINSLHLQDITVTPSLSTSVHALLTQTQNKCLLDKGGQLLFYFSCVVVSGQLPCENIHP